MVFHSAAVPGESRTRLVWLRHRRATAMPAGRGAATPFAVACFAVVFTMLAGAAAQPSDTAPEEGRRLFDEGNAAFAAEDYPAAVALFERSYAINPRPIVLYNLANAQRALFDFPAAIDSFREYLRMARDSVPAERRAEIDGFLVEMEAAIVHLTVRVNEPGAVILVDGMDAGRSPLARPLRLRPGAHVVEARKDGFEDARRTVSAGAGEALEVALTLAPRAVRRTLLRVVSDPPGALVEVDGRAIGAAPVEVEVEPGPHAVRVEAEGFVVAEAIAEVPEGQRREVVVALSPVVAASPPVGGAPPPGPDPLPEEEGGVLSSWWFWTLIGVAAAGGAATAGVLLWPDEGGRPAADRTVQVP